MPVHLDDYGPLDDPWLYEAVSWFDNTDVLDGTKLSGTWPFLVILFLLVESLILYRFSVVVRIWTKISGSYVWLSPRPIIKHYLQLGVHAGKTMMTLLLNELFPGTTGYIYIHLLTVLFARRIRLILVHWNVHRFLRGIPAGFILILSLVPEGWVGSHVTGNNFDDRQTPCGAGCWDKDDGHKEYSENSAYILGERAGVGWSGYSDADANAAPVAAFSSN